MIILTCKCGREYKTWPSRVKDGKAKSCGRKECRPKMSLEGRMRISEASKRRLGEGASNYRHGGNVEHKNEYNSWRAMVARCYYPKYRRFDLYGGRGITVCDRWLGKSGFPNFLEDMGKKPTKQHSIDRIDSNGNYEPDNCKWSTQRQQMNNVKNNRLFTVCGVVDTASNHARRYGINMHTAMSRIRQQGWEPETAFTTPTRGVGSNQATYK